jgi:hypothetical protein
MSTKPDWKKGFKVLSENKGSLFSFHPLCRIRYQKRKFNKPLPECGPLAVFDQLHTTLAFVSSQNSISRFHQNIVISRCKYKPYKGNRGDYLWFNSKKTSEIKYELPVGTRLADCVVLLGKPVHWNRIIRESDLT